MSDADSTPAAGEPTDAGASEPAPEPATAEPAPAPAPAPAPEAEGKAEPETEKPDPKPEDKASPEPEAAAGASASASAPSASSAEAKAEPAAAAAAAAGDDDEDDEEEDGVDPVYATQSTAGRGYVVCYGWMVKQGEGGFLKRKSWKRRFFVLYKVPHGSVLVYYNTDKPDAENIMGFVDLRQVTAVNLTKLPVSGEEKDVIEIVTTPRTYYVCPKTVQREISSAPSGNCINILGWPVSELEVGTQHDSDKEGYATQRRVLNTWRDGLSVACKFKHATMHAEVTTVTDSTTVLPDKVYIMVTPSDVVLLDGSEKDKAYACWPYRDLASWRAESRKNLQINVRSVSSTIRCTFAVSEDIPRDTGGLEFATTAFDLKKRIDVHIKALVALRKKAADKA